MCYGTVGPKVAAPRHKPLSQKICAWAWLDPRWRHHATPNTKLLILSMPLGLAFSTPLAAMLGKIPLPPTPPPHPSPQQNKHKAMKSALKDNRKTKKLSPLCNYIAHVCHLWLSSSGSSGPAGIHKLIETLLPQGQQIPPLRTRHEHQDSNTARKSALFIWQPYINDNVP